MRRSAAHGRADVADRWREPAREQHAAATTSASAAEGPHHDARELLVRAPRARPCRTARTRRRREGHQPTPSAVAGQRRDEQREHAEAAPLRPAAPSTIHQNNAAVATNDACSTACRPSWCTAAAYGPGRCHDASVTFAEHERDRGPRRPPAAGLRSAARAATPAARGAGADRERIEHDGERRRRAASSGGDDREQEDVLGHVDARRSCVRAASSGDRARRADGERAGRERARADADDPPVPATAQQRSSAARVDSAPATTTRGEGVGHVSHRSDEET